MAKQKKSKNISLGKVHIKATFNNTIVTYTDVQGNVIASSSSGAQGFQGAKKATPYAAQIVVDKVSEGARENGIKTLTFVQIKGPGPQREAAIRAVLSQGFVVMNLKDVSPRPHNGSRPPKRRRV